MTFAVDGSPAGIPYTGRAKSKTPVRSPTTLRRQTLMFGQRAGVPSAVVHVSMKRSTEVWSKTSELTQPPRVQGDMTSIGTRKPRPIGTPSRYSPGVPGGASGGGTWSKKPSFSS